MKILSRTFNFAVLSVCIAACIPTASAQGPSKDDVVMRAMRDELSRSMKKLQLENLDKPYFIAYAVHDTDSAFASATFGSLNGRIEEQKSRYARVQVRVGDYSLDSGNFYSPSFGGSGVTRSGGTVNLPIDDNYDEIRRQLWLATDSAYKKALEDLAKKRALLSNKNRSEAIPDFSQEPVNTVSDELPRIEIKLPEMEAMVRDLSLVFKEFPAISLSSVSLSITNESSRLVNSEGTSGTWRHPEVQMMITSSSQAPDGQPLAASFSYRQRDLRDFPSKEKIMEDIRTRCRQVTELRTAPLPDRYAGPILFEGEAASEIVWNEFLWHLTASPAILSDNPRNAMNSDSENLVEKIGLRILPEFVSVVDDPTVKAHGNTPLVGTFKADGEGVPSRRVQLVENGLLMNLLAGRAPVQGIPHSTGSHHDGGVTPSNFIMTSSRSLPIDALRAELVRRAKLRGKDYGYIVRKVDSRTRAGENSGLAPGSLPVLLAYKHFADGHEELVRNPIINGIKFSSFKDILAVSDTAIVRNSFYSPRSANPYENAGSCLVSLVVPSLLFEDATVQKPTGSVNKPPLSEHPYFSKK